MPTGHARVCLLGGLDEHSIRMAIALACACVLTPGAHVLAAERPMVHRVIIEGTAYHPATLTIKRGDTVEWVNQDPFPHTVTAAPAFDSKNIAAGKSWRYTAKTAGEYSYVCLLHPNMKGTVEVR